MAISSPYQEMVAVSRAGGALAVGTLDVDVQHGRRSVHLHAVLNHKCVGKGTLAGANLNGYTAPLGLNRVSTRSVRVTLHPKVRRWLLVAGVFLVVFISYLFVYFMNR